MLGSLARRVFGSANDRIVKGLKRSVDKINALEPRFTAMSDAELQQQTALFRERLQQGETLDDLLFEAFATVREAGKRALGQRHFDVQLMGGLVLHEGKIAEMRTGEGKTLVATLPVYLNALEGKGVHVITVNDYLASRDAAWMSRIYNFLGLTVGVIINGTEDAERQAAYQADITYGTNNEFGFDYLRDNMKLAVEEMVQRPFNFAIVDEVDSILIDEARTPLIISGAAQDSSEFYIMANRLIAGNLQPEDYEKDEKQKTVHFTEHGVEKIERLLQEAGLLKHGGLYDTVNVSLVHHTTQALRAHTLFTADVDYIVKDGKVVIIDEFTGRMMPGRRYSEGLHQALEAKEGVNIEKENQTLASITFQNYFRLYPKLAGMTGTALTEAAEFYEIYKLEVVDMPTNRPVQRIDDNDEVYRTLKEKNTAIVTLIEQCRARQQPVLVGTVSIEKSEQLSDFLQKKNIPHQVLNARYHEQEAEIIADAGIPGAVTIATNMAGRGTDIQLGGNLQQNIRKRTEGVEDESARAAIIAEVTAEIEANKKLVMEAGGLCVIGTERHESRRIDNQLRGRSGRQGDPGQTRFYLSLEDDLLRIFGSQRMDGMLVKMGMQEGEAITHPWINKAIEKAQQKVEASNFEVRKNLLKFDDVLNDQRKAIYNMRKEILSTASTEEIVTTLRHHVIEQLVEDHIPERSFAEQWNMEGLSAQIAEILTLREPVVEWGKEDGIAEEEIIERLKKAHDRKWAEKKEAYGEENMRMMERTIFLSILDFFWRMHLLNVDHLRQGISLRAYGQRDPLNEYKKEAFSLFYQMMEDMRVQAVTAMSNTRANLHEAAADLADDMGSSTDNVISLAELSASLGVPLDVLAKSPRNAVCPCGSGRKFKYCHGQL
ncbi:MAG: preprotein translocase subunit SecA [Alphaproteobacteria bacterium]